MHVALEQREQSTGSCVILWGEARYSLQHFFHERRVHGVTERDFNYLRKEVCVATGGAEHAGQGCNPLRDGGVGWLLREQGLLLHDGKCTSSFIRDGASV